MANEYYERLSEMNPGDLADGLAMEAEFDAIAQAFGKLPTPHTGGQGFDGPVRVGDATNPDEAINKKQLEEAMGTAKQLAVAAYGNFNATAWATLPSGTYLLFGTGSQITNSPFPLAEAKTYYLTVRHAIGDNLYCDSLLMASLDDSAHADIGREAWRSGPTLAVASAGWKAAVFKSGDTVTGDILGVTAPQFANDKKFATTEFVQRALGNISGGLVIAAATTLAASDVGKYIRCGGSTYTVTLPKTSDVPEGATLFICGSQGTTADVATIATQGTDRIETGSGALPSVSLRQSSTLMLIKHAGQWVMFDEARLPYSQMFQRSLSANGYQKLPGGLIIQWAHPILSPAGTIKTFSFPIAFPSACYVITQAHDNANLTPAGISAFACQPISASQYQVQSSVSSGNAGCWIIAIGS
ncbi:gp53-like domain-containing protein [Aeromonas caviae]|uniref:gp53-like domain-containing protein n=1 Tax=Aeromonas caviae TaxID=648 RepID=UPI0022818B69|nr:hypothetical protein [Aeromonas caviae]MCY9814478.1 hypothetical protein [Aeromonas caviae]